MERFYSAGENFSRNTIGLGAEKPKAFLQPKENPAKKGPGRTQLRAAGAVWFALLQFDLARLRLRRRPLRQIKLQYTVVIGGFDRLRIYVGDIKAAGKRTIAALAADITVLVLARFGIVLCRNRQRFAIEINFDVLLIKAGQLCLEHIPVAFIKDIGAYFRKTSREIVKECFFKRIKKVRYISGLVFKRHQVKHKSKPLSKKLLLFPDLCGILSALSVDIDPIHCNHLPSVL